MTTAFDDKPLEPIGRRRGGSFDRDDTELKPRQNPAQWLKKTWAGISPIYQNAIKLGAVVVPVVAGVSLLGSFGNAPEEMMVSIAPSPSAPSSDDEHAQINTALWGEVRTSYSQLKDETTETLQRLQQSRGQRWWAWAVSQCLDRGCEPSERLFEVRTATLDELIELSRFGVLETDTDTAEEFRSLSAKLADLDAALAASRDERQRQPVTQISIVDFSDAAEDFETAIGTYLNPVNQIAVSGETNGDREEEEGGEQ